MFYDQYYTNITTNYYFKIFATIDFFGNNMLYTRYGEPIHISRRRKSKLDNHACLVYSLRGT